MKHTDSVWLAAMRETIASYRRLIDAAVVQLTDDELHRRPSPELNSVAVLLRHLGGNLRSRWTDFFTTDGEKPDRNRDEEFADWKGDRESLIAYFDAGWQAFSTTIETLDESDLDKTVLIRGEPHTVPQAILRAITHISYHVGQIAMVARSVHEGDWKWLTIAPHASRQHNAATWGTSASRSIFGSDDE